MKHRATIHCGSCSCTTEVALGSAHIIGCEHCGAQIQLCADTPIEEQPLEQIVEELGGVAVIDLMRQTALSAIMPQMAATLRQMPCARAEATLAHILWYLTDYRGTDGVNLPTVLKLLRLCEIGGVAGAREGWLVGPTAQA